MVGIFSRFSVGSRGHRRARSALDEREVLPPNVEVAGGSAGHGIEVAVEFKPLEHPVEPFDNDQPVKCPLPEPSILNDGRIWKERMSATSRRSSLELPTVKEGSSFTPESNGIKSTRPRPARSNRSILPSLSAPEHNLINLLEECNASGI